MSIIFNLFTLLWLPISKSLYMRLKPNITCNICFCKTKINIREDSLITLKYENQILLPTISSSLTCGVGKEETIYFSPFPIPYKLVKGVFLFKISLMTHNKTYSRIKLIIASKIVRKTQTSYLS